VDVYFLGRPNDRHIWLHTSISEKITTEMDTKASIPATKEDLALTFENTRAVLRSTTKSLIRWMFSFGFLT
jgi:hypothetical protein